ncbi:MAG: CBS domain-containing protein [Terriglobales bacterium]
MPSIIPEQLKQVAQEVNQGTERSETVRTLLSWFDAERRGYWKAQEIRKALKKVRLKTEPDFEDAWIDAKIKFLAKLKKEKASIVGQQEADPTAEKNIEECAPESPVLAKDSSGIHSRIKIGVLAAANTPPVCISPDAEVSEAITLMLQHDFSQLPVRTTERDVKGIITWKSLGSRLALGRQCKKIRECMEPATEILSDASLFEAIQQIVEHECVLVRDATRKLTGIVTTEDLSRQFAQLGEPFLLLGQIENHVRDLIANKFTKAELATARDPGDSGREIEDVSDLTFGEYTRLLENPKRWETFSIQIDRKTFTDQLKKVGEIRNDVMHFHPDGVDPEALETLRNFARFLNDLEKKLV